MKFLCPNCKAKYQIADEKVSGRTLRMDCRRCGHNITIRADMAVDDAEDAAPKTAPAPARTAAPTSATASTRGRAGLTGPHSAAVTHGAAAHGAAGHSGAGALGADFRKNVASSPEAARPTPLDQWHVAINDVPVGPLRRDEIVKKIGLGAITPESLCWREGLDDWRPLRDVPELAALLRRSLAPEPARQAARPGPAAPPPRAPAPAGMGGVGRAAPAAPGRAAARSNVVPIGGRLGASAAPAFDDDELQGEEPTRVGSVDLAEMEAKAVAAEREAKRAAEEARAEQRLAEQKIAEAKAAEARAIQARAAEKAAEGALFADVKRPPTGKTSTGAAATGLAPPPKPTRPDTGKTALPKPVAPMKAAPAPMADEPELPFEEPAFADVPAPAPVALAPAPAALAPAALASAALASAPPAVQAAPAAPASIPPREEKRRGGGIPIPALIAIAGATAFGGVLAFMIGSRYLGPTAEVTPAVAAVQPPVTPEPPPTAPPAAEVQPPPEPPATTPEPPATTTPEPPPTTAPAAGAHTRPHTGGTAAATTATPAGGAQATKAPSGRFAAFADQGGDDGPAPIATTGPRSIADEAEGTGGGSSTRGQSELTADQIRGVITRERPAVNRCWESELRRLGQAATVRLDVDLTIGGSGTVTSVTTRGQSVGGLSECIERNVRRWRFPPVNGSTQTSFPLVFSGTE